MFPQSIQGHLGNINPTPFRSPTQVAPVRHHKRTFRIWRHQNRDPPWLLSGMYDLPLPSSAKCLGGKIRIPRFQWQANELSRVQENQLHYQRKFQPCPQETNPSRQACTMIYSCRGGRLPVPCLSLGSLLSMLCLSLSCLLPVPCLCPACLLGISCLCSACLLPACCLCPACALPVS